MVNGCSAGRRDPFSLARRKPSGAFSLTERASLIMVMMATAAAAHDRSAAMIELLQAPYTIGSLIDRDMRAFLYCRDCDETSDIDLHKLADEVGRDWKLSVHAGR